MGENEESQTQSQAAQGHTATSSPTVLLALAEEALTSLVMLSTDVCSLHSNLQLFLLQGIGVATLEEAETQ